MTLGFSTRIDGNKTNFVPQIWNAALKRDLFNLQDLEVYSQQFQYTFGEPIWSLGVTGEKIHTFRKDTTGRWKVGMPIHFAVHNQTPKRFQFAPMIKVKCLEFIEIDWINEYYPYITISNAKGQEVLKLNPDHHFEYISALEDIAKNDGFANAESFLSYFKDSGEYTIIHWTDFSYEGNGDLLTKKKLGMMNNLDHIDVTPELFQVVEDFLSISGLTYSKGKLSDHREGYCRYSFVSGIGDRSSILEIIMYLEGCYKVNDPDKLKPQRWPHEKWIEFYELHLKRSGSKFI